MKVKTAELTGAALDWAVAKCKEAGLSKGYWTGAVRRGNFTPSTDWAQGGPLIERELIDVQAKYNSGSDIVPKGKWYWQASTVNEDDVAYWFDGPTPLIAAMRCYVASKLGDEVEIPDELI